MNLAGFGDGWADVEVRYDVAQIGASIARVTLISVTLVGAGDPVDVRWLVDLGFYSSTDIAKACLDDFLATVLTVVTV
jgi:hypothetical protein